MRPTFRVGRGLPGAGKTTLLKAWVAADPDHRVRVAYDDLRTMFHGERLNTSQQLKQSLIGARALAAGLLAAGVSVALDGVTLDDAEFDDWRQVAAEHGARLEVIDLRDMPVDECIRRDAARGAEGGRMVGEAIIRQMAATGGRVLPA